MAPAKGNDDANGDGKRTLFRCLDAGRYVVAAAVTILILAVIVYAVTVVLRPGDLAVWIVGGSISVERDGGGGKLPSHHHVGGSAGTLSFRFTVRAVNPSGRLRIYYTGVVAKLSGRNSTGTINYFLILRLPDSALAQQSTVDSNVQATGSVTSSYQEYYFKALANDTSIADASLKLNGTRIVENYSGHNMTAVRAVYYCSRLAVGGDDDGTAAVDVQCTEDPPTSS